MPWKVMLASACMQHHTDKQTKVIQHMQCMKRHVQSTIPPVLQQLATRHCTHQYQTLPAQHNQNGHDDSLSHCQ